MQPLGTLKHTRGLSYNTEARPHIGGICTSSLHTPDWCAQKDHLQCSIRDQSCLFRVQLSFLHPRAFHGSLLPTALSPNKPNPSRNVEGSPTCPRTQGHLFLSFLILSAFCSGQRLSSSVSHMKPLLTLLPIQTPASLPSPASSPPPELYLNQPPDFSEAKLPGSSPDSSLLRQGHDLPNDSRVLARTGVKAGSKSYGSHMSHLSTDLGMSNALRNLNSC